MAMELPKFCTACGLELVTSVENSWTKFDSATGRPSQHANYRIRCPRAHWWNSHSRYKQWGDVYLQDENAD